MRRRLAFLLALAAPLLATGPSGAAPLTVADAFRSTPLLGVRLSPDGKRLLAFVWKEGQGTGTVVIDTATMKPQLLQSYAGRPWTARWLGNDLIVLAVGRETHVYDTTGKVFKLIDGQFTATLPPDGDGHERILVSIDRDTLSRIDVRTRQSIKVSFDWPDGKPWRGLIDREGVPRVVTTLSHDGTSLTHWIRHSATAPWQMLESQLAIDSRWTPLDISRDGRSLSVLSSEGRDTAAVFRYSVDEHALKEVMAGHPTEDIGAADVAEGGDGSEAGEGDAGTFYRVVTMGMKTTVHWFDPKWNTLQESVDAALPGRVNWISGSFAVRKMLIFSTGDVDPGTWYLLELEGMTLREIGSIKPEIDRKAMLPTQIVRYKSLDGTEIPAYLTLPAGGTRDLPAVVLVHGGPVLRDRWGWDAEVQMLASRGYVVLQPQFRGSAGFGNRFTLSGNREWGRAMQDDVTAGAQWLAQQGIADAGRMCIYGASYGGYAALWALVKTPDLFRCGASLAGVSDLRLMLADDSDVNQSELGRLFRLRMVGDASADASRLDEVSPLKGAARIRAPVLLAHGDLDRRVPIVHSEKMLEALKANGKQVEWVLLRREAHGISSADNRERFYKALFDFLARHTAPSAASTSSAPAITSGASQPAQ